MPGISYQLIKLILRLKGTKKVWSQSPINYRKLRREDVHRPSKRMLTGGSVTAQAIRGTTVTELTPPDSESGHLLFYCPGGAFVYGPTEMNWRFMAHLSRKTQTKAWLLDYPKAPENNIHEICNNVDEVYQAAIEQYNPSQIILLGDSVGGTLLFSLIQRLIKEGKELPKRLIAVTLVADASLSNPEIEQVDRVDLILSRPGVLSAKQLAAGGLDLQDPMISPYYGNFEGFPPTFLWVATHDILYPDQLKLIEKMREQQAQVKVFHGEEMPHIWPLLPVLAEAKEAKTEIIKIITNAKVNEHQKTSSNYS